MIRKYEYIRFIVLFLLMFLLSSMGFAEDDVFMIHQKGFIQFSPVYQRWSDYQGNGLSEFSTPVNLYLPLGKNASLSLLGNQAVVSGDAVEKLRGITDTQMNVTYHVEAAKMILTLGVNLPTGRKELSLEEFETSYLISLNMYDFRVSNFGQGFNVSPGLSWAYPLSETAVVGIGLSYQYRGPFKPFENMTGQYDPGNEILVTGGFDFRLSETATLSTDLIYTIYGTDRLGGEEVFVSGEKISVNVQLRFYSGYNERSVFGRYRSKAKNEVAIAGNLLPEEEKTIPDQFELIGRYKIRLNEKFYTTIVAEGRFFQETSVFTRTSILAVGFEPQLTVTPNLKIPMRFKYLIGSIENGPNIKGIETGAGLYLNF